MALFSELGLSEDCIYTPSGTWGPDGVVWGRKQKKGRLFHSLESA